MKVAEIIKKRKKVYFISPDLTADRIARYLKKRKIRAVAVFNTEKTIGVVSQSDLCNLVVAKNHRNDEIIALNIMSSSIVVIDPETRLNVAEQLMINHNIYHLVVTDNGIPTGRLLGLISRRDIDLMRIHEKEEELKLYKEYTFPSY